MRQTASLLLIFITSVTLLSGCSTTGNSNQTTPTPTATQTVDANGNTIDPDGFVRFPGEPTRQTDKYVIVEDICGQFTKKYMEGVLEKTIVSTQGPRISSLYNCSYYFDDKRFVMLGLDYLNVADQKKGSVFLGRTVQTDARIPMDHFIIYQEDGAINSAVLALGTDKFIALELSGKDALTNDEIISLLIKLGTKMKDMQ